MAQPERKENTDDAINSGFGYYDRVEFGKYKGTENANVYRIANQGDFKYLRWILTTNSRPVKEGENKFIINPTVIPHAAAAIRIQGETTKWKENFTQDLEDSTLWRKQYTTEDNRLEGPVILYRQCGLCNRRKNIDVIEVYNGRKVICKNCYKQIFT